MEMIEEPSCYPCPKCGHELEYYNNDGWEFFFCKKCNDDAQYNIDPLEDNQIVSTLISIDFGSINISNK